MFAALKRSLFICGAFLLTATVAFADGSYQRTRDGKTRVWNNAPTSGDEASWSGQRDREGYAKGFGTLTWFTAPSGRGGSSAVYARYFGNMVRGKFIGPVNAHSKRKTAHALFVDGKRTSRWVSGPAPSWRVAQAPAKPVPAPAEPEAPGEGILQAKPVFPRSGVQQQTENMPPARKTRFDKFLRVLVEPPSTLRTPRPAPPAPDTGPRLSREEVTELADAEGRARGYHLTSYQPPALHYNAADKTWLVFYEQRPFNAIDEPGKDFQFVIDDTTRGSAIPDN